MSIKKVIHRLLLISTMAGAMAQAAPVVTELGVADVAVFVAKHEVAVVQATSPDPKCRYCIGADKIFDQAASLPQDKRIAYARVQWTPWHKMPDFGSLMQVYGAPGQFVFMNGKVIGKIDGKPRDAQTLAARIQAIIDHPAAPRDDRADSPQASPATEKPIRQAMSEKETALTRLWIRRDFLQGITTACAKLFPDQANLYEQSFTSWQEARKTALNDAARVMLVRSSREDAKETTKLATDEEKALQEWQVKQLGIPLDKKPLAADCAKIAKNLPSLPE